MDLRELSLNPSWLIFLGPEAPRIFGLISVGVHRKAFQAHINSHNRTFFLWRDSYISFY